MRFEGLEEGEFDITAVPADQEKAGWGRPEGFSVSGVGRPGEVLQLFLDPVVRLPLVDSGIG